MQRRAHGPLSAAVAQPGQKQGDAAERHPGISGIGFTERAPDAAAEEEEPEDPPTRGGPLPSDWPDGGRGLAALPCSEPGRAPIQGAHCGEIPVSH